MVDLHSSTTQLRHINTAIPFLPAFAERFDLVVDAAQSLRAASCAYIPAILSESEPQEVSIEVEDSCCPQKLRRPENFVHVTMLHSLTVATTVGGDRTQ